MTYVCLEKIGEGVFRYVNSGCRTFLEKEIVMEILYSIHEKVVEFFKKEIFVKKIFSIIGMFVGLAFILVGILTISGELGGKTIYVDSPEYRYDYGYAQFGTDYYSYTNNNMYYAARGSVIAANSIRNIADFLLRFCGIFSILFGLMIICAFAILLASCFKKVAPQPVDVISYPVYKEVAPSEVTEE